MTIKYGLQVRFLAVAVAAFLLMVGLTLLMIQRQHALQREVADAAPYPDATPLNGPGWFQCYSSKALTADLEAGNAKAILGQSEVHADVDRVLIVYPDGRAFGWHQLNDKTPARGVMD